MEYLVYFLFFLVVLLASWLTQAERRIKELETWTDTIDDLENRIIELEDRLWMWPEIEDLS